MFTFVSIHHTQEVVIACNNFINRQYIWSVIILVVCLQKFKICTREHHNTSNTMSCYEVALVTSISKSLNIAKTNAQFFTGQ